MKWPWIRWSRFHIPSTPRRLQCDPGLATAHSIRSWKRNRHGKEGEEGGEEAGEEKEEEEEDEGELQPHL